MEPLKKTENSNKSKIYICVKKQKKTKTHFKIVEWNNVNKPKVELIKHKIPWGDYSFYLISND